MKISMGIAAFVLALFGCIFFAPMPAGAQAMDPSIVETPSDPAGAVAAAHERLASGDLAGATSRLAFYVYNHPKEIYPARFLGDLYYRQGKLQEAEAIYRSILSSFPADRDTHNRLGAVFASEDRVDDAIGEYDKSLPADAIQDLVQLHIRKGDIATYELRLSRQAQANPSDAESQQELGQAYLAREEYGLALHYFSLALDLNPSSPYAWNFSGLAYLGLGDYRRAFSQFDHCLMLNATSFACLLNYASAKLESRDFENAKHYLARARTLEPDSGEVLVNYGYLSDAQGEWKAAIAFYLKALTMAPYLRDAYLNLGNDYETHKLYELAESALLKGISVAPRDPALHYVLARTYQDQQKNALARAQFEAAYSVGDPRVSELSRVHLAQLGVPVPATVPHS